MKKIFVSTIILFLASWIYAEKDYNVDAKTGASMPVQKVEITPSYRLFPANKAKGVPPDTHLTIEFDSPVQLNNKGVIRIYESHTGRLVDTLDMNIPAGPTEPDMIRKQKSDLYHRTVSLRLFPLHYQRQHKSRDSIGYCHT